MLVELLTIASEIKKLSRLNHISLSRKGRIIARRGVTKTMGFGRLFVALRIRYLRVRDSVSCASFSCSVCRFIRSQRIYDRDAFLA